MFWFSKYFVGCGLRFPEDGNGSGGGGQGGSGGDGKGGDGKGGDGGGGSAGDDLKALTARLDKLEKENAELRAKGQGGGSGNGSQDEDLAAKAKREREAKEKNEAESKTLSTAIKYNMQVADWAKTNATLLPQSVEGLIAQAEKQNYGTEIEKANAIKVGVVQEFFAQQANLDLLTDSQKATLDQFKALTNTEKVQRVAKFFDDVFEPTFLALKRIKKQDQLAKGHGAQSDSETKHVEKMKAFAKKHHLKESK